MNTDYHKIKTRFASNVIIDALISCEEAAYKIHKLFYDDERFVYEKNVMFEKFNRNGLTKPMEHKTHLEKNACFL